VIGGAYAVANKTLANSQQAQEHSEALKIAEGQLEQLKVATTPEDLTYPSCDPICSDPADAADPADLADLSDPALPSDPTDGSGTQPALCLMNDPRPECGGSCTKKTPGCKCTGFVCRLLGVRANRGSDVAVLESGREVAFKLAATASKTVIFCFNKNGNGDVVLFPGNPASVPADEADYPDECAKMGLGEFFRTAIKYSDNSTAGDPLDDFYTVYVQWPGPTGHDEQVSMSYRAFPS
jgi:hypothetical protein